ncbi:MAG: nicotinate-nucleotide adenylyltransferase [Bacteroidales bacterium]|nr:nicotinate-nucleotide adenylyltransferase [Candidatus Physcocola equi]
MRKVALFCGSFNPIHIGHLALCSYVAEFCDVDEVRFVVSPQNPFKVNVDLLDDDLRLEMVKRAVQGFPKFTVSDVEFSLPKPSYTYVTLQHLSESEPDAQFILMMGGDNLDAFRKWKNYEWIMKNYPIWVYSRLGSSNQIPSDFVNFTLLKTPIIEISSTFIRNSIADNKNVDYFLHPAVSAYIKVNGLYK